MTSDRRTEADEIFLSPRVIDRDAFDDYCGALREMIEDARRLGESLTRQTAQAKSAAQDFAKLEPAASAKAESVARLLTTIDERATVLRNLVDQAELRTQALDEAESRASDLIDRKLESFRASIDKIVSDAESRLSASAVEATTRLANAARDAEASLALARDEAAESAAAGVRRLETLGESLGGELADNAADAREQLRQTLADIEDRSEPMRRDLERSVGEIEDRLDRLRKQALALMGPGVRELESLCEQGAALLGRSAGSDDAPSPGSLAEVAQNLAKAGGAARSTLERLQTLRDELESSRSSLSESIVASAQWLDRLSEQHASLDESLSRSLERCRDAEAAMKNREADLRAALVEPRRRLESDLAELMELRTELRTSREELESVIQQHTEASASMTRDVERLEALIERARKTSSGASTGSTPSNALEPDTRRALADELARMAAAIESLGQPRESAAGDDRGATVEVKPRKAAAGTSGNGAPATAQAKKRAPKAEAGGASKASKTSRTRSNRS